jgi:hypothetical protein
MANTNDFVPFGTATGANVLAPGIWAADPSRSAGFSAGIAPSVKLNTAWRQASSIATMIAQFTADFGPGNVVDNGNIPVLEAQFEAALNKFLGPFFIPLIPQTTWFVDHAVGSDSFDGTTSTVSGSHGPWLTIQHAVNVLSNYSFGGQTVTIQMVSAGTYAGPINISNVTNGILLIQGNGSAQASYTISGNSPLFGGLIQVTGGQVSLRGFTLSNQATGITNNLEIVDATCTIQNITFGGVTGAAGHATAAQSATININSGCIWAQSCASALNSSNGSTIIIFANMTTSGTPVWSNACAVAANLGDIAFGGGGGWIFTNTGATGPRYSAVFNGVINTSGSGANFFPGNSAGTPAIGVIGATGGVYG